MTKTQQHLSSTFPLSAEYSQLQLLLLRSCRWILLTQASWAHLKPSQAAAWCHIRGVGSSEGFTLFFAAQTFFPSPRFPPSQPGATRDGHEWMDVPTSSGFPGCLCFYPRIVDAVVKVHEFKKRDKQNKTWDPLWTGAVEVKLLQNVVADRGSESIALPAAVRILSYCGELPVRICASHLDS